MYRIALTVIEILRFRVVDSADRRKLDLLKALALDTCTSLETLLGIRKLFPLHQQKLERHAVHSVDLVLEVEYLDKAVVRRR